MINAGKTRFAGGPDSEESVLAPDFETLRLEIDPTNQTSLTPRPAGLKPNSPSTIRKEELSSSFKSAIENQNEAGNEDHDTADKEALNQKEFTERLAVKTNTRKVEPLMETCHDFEIKPTFEVRIDQGQSRYYPAHQSEEEDKLTKDATIKASLNDQSSSSSQSQRSHGDYDSAVRPKEKLDSHNNRRYPADVPVVEVHLPLSNPKQLGRLLKDQESQVSDSLSVAFRKIPEEDLKKASQSVQVNIGATTAGSPSSHQAASFQTAKEEDNLPPPPSYSQCCGIELNQSQAPQLHQSEAPKGRNETITSQPHHVHFGGAEGGDVPARQKPPPLRRQTMLRRPNDGHCEVLVLQPEQSSSRPRSSDSSNGDHHLLAFLSCLLFWPIGLLAIYYANMANALKSEGYLQQSLYYSKRAVALSLTAIAIGTVMYFIFYLRHKLHHSM